MQQPNNTQPINTKNISAFTHAIYFTRHPGLLFLKPFLKRFEKKYKGKHHYAKTMFTIDLLLVGIVLSLTIVAFVLFLFKPDFTEQVYLEAQVAPKEVISGAPSTLVIHYTNATGEELRQAKLRLEFPEHFLLKEISFLDESISPESKEINLGTIVKDGNGFIKIRGIMFGDIGSQQIFKSFLTFVHGEKNIFEQKKSSYAFSPNSSTLALELHFPKELVFDQYTQGSITYKNTGEIDLPEIFIEPQWPKEFVFLTSTPAWQNGWHLPALASGEEGTITFEGTLASTADIATFTFYPSFVFGNTTYKQKILQKHIPLVPAQVKISHSLVSSFLSPGSTVEATVFYKNTGDIPVSEVTVSLTSESPFFDSSQEVSVGNLEPQEEGETKVKIHLRSSIQQSETRVYENLSMDLRAKATYLQGEPAQKVISQGEETSFPITSPVGFHSFARYSSPQGDQLGRGPLPPLVGEETKYWIFWNVSGTTNPIEQIRLTGVLPNNVRFTGKQTVSQNGGIIYDPEEHTVLWQDDSMQPTLDPNSKIIGIAFEIALTPTQDQVGHPAELLSQVTLTATDGKTGAFLSASSEKITTDLPHDEMAAGLGNVQY